MRYHTLIDSLLLVVTLTAVLLMTSCNVNDSDEFTDTFSYQINEQSVVRVDSMQRLDRQDSLSVQTFSVEGGDSTVFIFDHNQTPPEDILDGGFSETLVFQIPADVNQFEFRDDKLANTRVFYKRGCFYELAGAGFQATSGFIRGERLSAVHWFVSADVTIESSVGTFQVQFKKPVFVE